MQAPGDPSVAAPRSTGVTVFGAVMLGFGALGVLSMPLALLGRFVGAHSGGSRVQALMWTGTYGAWMMASIGLRTLLRLLLAACGLGVLGRRRWAKSSTIVYAVLAIGLSVAEQMINIVFLYPRLFDLSQTGSTVERSGAIGGLAGGVFGGVFGMILPIAILIVVTRPAVRAELGA